MLHHVGVQDGHGVTVRDTDHVPGDGVGMGGKDERQENGEDQFHDLITISTGKGDARTPLWLNLLALKLL